jgi:hypothetical protein
VSIDPSSRVEHRAGHLGKVGAGEQDGAASEVPLTKFCISAPSSPGTWWKVEEKTDYQAGNRFQCFFRIRFFAFV